MQEADLMPYGHRRDHAILANAVRRPVMIKPRFSERMHTMRTFPTRTALFTALLACAPLAFAAVPPASSAQPGSSAQSMHHGDGHMRDHRMGMGMLDQLNLTDAQHTSIRELRQQSFTAARPAMQTLRQQRMAFERATPGSADYQTAANTLAQAEADAAHAQVLREADLRSKIYNVLTPAQRTQLASLKEQRKARMQKWREAHTRHTMTPPGAPAPATSSR
jgi:Spy/CpxP family protein refolding chaperone